MQYRAFFCRKTSFGVYHTDAIIRIRIYSSLCIESVVISAVTIVVAVLLIPQLLLRRHHCLYHLHPCTSAIASALSAVIFFLLRPSNYAPPSLITFVGNFGRYSIPSLTFHNDHHHLLLLHSLLLLPPPNLRGLLYVLIPPYHYHHYLPPLSVAGDNNDHHQHQNHPC